MVETEKCPNSCRIVAREYSSGLSPTQPRFIVAELAATVLAAVTTYDHEPVVASKFMRTSACAWSLIFSKVILA